MTRKLTTDEIRSLGFDWPRYEVIEEHCVVEDGKIDLSKTIEKMETSRVYYKRQLDEAFAFKMQHSADYADFTNRHEEYAQQYYKFGQAISYLDEVIQAVERN